MCSIRFLPSNFFWAGSGLPAKLHVGHIVTHVSVAEHNKRKRNALEAAPPLGTLSSERMGIASYLARFFNKLMHSKRETCPKLR